MQQPFHDFRKNNLSRSLSPYLRQHADNPVWWQEFSEEVLQYAQSVNKPVLLSGGYSTCHWCHVMSAEAFSHQPTAEFLNNHFVSIKIDREMRPDIDAWMMSYVQETTGQGGWPLNVFVNHEMKPFFAVMYAPSEEGKYGRPSFLRILEHVLTLYNRPGHNPEAWTMIQQVRKVQSTERAEYDQMMLNAVISYADMENGGLYGSHKFPPHATLHYLLTVDHGREELDDFVRFTLMKMAAGGLHDHLQGGFYRYCIDPEWNIPHFEKMLYDQAMMLMNYSLAAHRFQAPAYRDVVKQLMNCLDDTFMINGMYASAWDADTNHEEGLTYLWTEDELASILSPQELKTFLSAYSLIPFEGKFHLHRNDADPVDEISEKLLEVRKKKLQPFRDEKIITSWNALAGIGFVMAERYAGFRLPGKAKKLFDHLIRQHLLENGLLAHSSIDGQLQKETFLEDMASMLLLATYLAEESGVDPAVMENIHEGLLRFHVNEQWCESIGGVLGNIPAASHDHPFPSGISMAEAAIARYSLITGKPNNILNFNQPLSSDYLNLAVRWSRGDFPVVSGPEALDFARLPAGTVFHFAEKYTLCRNFTCIETTVEELYKMFAGDRKLI
jgi:uncharacterized protein